MTFIAFLAGFYFGILLCSLMLVAERRKAKEKESAPLVEQPQIQQTASL